MKKRIVILSTMLVATCAYSQDMGDDQVPKNKKGNEILPKAGDIGLGFNTIPILDLFMNTFKSSNVSAGNIVQYSNANNQVTGKYFLNAKTAIRVRFGINTLSGTIVNRVQDAEAMGNALTGTADDIAAASLLRVEDRMSFRKNNVMLSVGLEKRRGYRRLQGFYGAEIGIGNTGAQERIHYGNGFSDQHETYFTNNFNSMTTTTVNPSTPVRVSRNTQTDYKGGFRVGLRGFIGIEYFIFTKISIGAEYGWGYSIATQRAAKSKREVYFNGQNGPTVVNETVNTDSHEILKGFSVDNNNGALFSLNNTLNGNTALGGGAGALILIFHF